MRISLLKCLLGVFLCSSSGFTLAEDPFEPVNRVLWRFNMFVDHWAFRPLAKGYRAVTPDLVERGMNNVFANIDNLPAALNNLLQGKVGEAGQDLTRFVLNFSFGGFGLYDFASDAGLPIHREDFGQTLGYWGIPQGPYVVLPFLGPSGARDVVGWFGDLSANPYDLIEPDEHSTAASVTMVIAKRASLLGLDELAPSDDYTFYRDAYLQRREAQVRDGQLPKEDDDFLSDDF